MNLPQRQKRCEKKPSLEKQHSTKNDLVEHRPGGAFLMLERGGCTVLTAIVLLWILSKISAPVWVWALAWIVFAVKTVGLIIEIILKNVIKG